MKIHIICLVCLLLSINFALAGTQMIGVNGDLWNGNVSLLNSKQGIIIGDYSDTIIPYGDIDNNFSSSDGYSTVGTNVSIMNGHVEFLHSLDHNNRHINTPLSNPRQDFKIFFDINITNALNLDLERFYVGLTGNNESIWLSRNTPNPLVWLNFGHWSGVIATTHQTELSNVYTSSSPSYDMSLDTLYHISLERTDNITINKIYDSNYNLLNVSTGESDLNILNYLIMGSGATEGMQGGTVDNLLCEEYFDNGSITKNWTSSINVGEELSILKYSGSGTINLLASTNGISYTLIQSNAISENNYDVSGNGYKYAKWEQNSTSPIYNITGTWAAISNSFDIYIINETQTLIWFNTSNYTAGLPAFNLTWGNRIGTTGNTSTLYYANGTSITSNSTYADGNVTLIPGFLIPEGIYYTEETATTTIETFVVGVGAFVAVVVAGAAVVSRRVRRGISGFWNKKVRRR